MFPYAGAKTTYEEAKQFYTVLGAGDRLHWIVGPGRHGNLGPLMPDILAFFLQSLKVTLAGAPKPSIVPISAPPREAQLCTKTGQVATSLGGETIFSINQRRADALLALRATPTRTQLRGSVVALTHVYATPGARLGTLLKDVQSSAEHGDHVVKVLTIEDEGSLLPAVLSTPTAGRHPVTLVLNSNPSEADVEPHSPADHVVLVLGLRPSPTGGEPAHCVDSNGNSCTTMNPKFLGPFYLMAQRAMLVDRTLLGLRMDDIFVAINGLCRQRYADCSGITAEGSGPYATVLLYAALLDPRFAHLTVDHSLISYRSVVDSNLHRNVSESILPGVLLHYDLPDIVAALGKRVTVTSSIGADDEVIP
jgi:hypothetical protein